MILEEEVILEKEVDLAAARDAITKKVLSARTFPDIREAQQTLRAWIKLHPEDEGMRDGFEQLSLMQDVAEAEQTQTDARATSHKAVLTK